MHPIITLWCHPRSRSTAMERVLLETDVFEIFHEPFSYYHYLEKSERPFPNFHPEDDHPRTFDGICDMILAAAKKRPVFFKDMSYYVSDRLVSDQAFFENFTSTFLIRDPAAAFLSYLKLDPDFTTEEAGIEAQWHHVEHLRSLNGKTPTIVSSDDLVANPTGVFKAFSKAIGMTLDEGALSWQPGVPSQWEYAKDWHVDASESQGIQQQNVQEAVDLNAHPRLQGLVEHHAPFYEKLMALRLGV